MNKLLACTAFATIGLLSTPAFASETAAEPAYRCRVGNGKSATYHSDVNACTLARAQGKKTLMLPVPADEQPAARPAAKPAPKPAKAKPNRQARRAGSR